jgi:hypothetical protein
MGQVSPVASDWPDLDQTTFANGQQSSLSIKELPKGFFQNRTKCPLHCVFFLPTGS